MVVEHVNGRQRHADHGSLKRAQTPVNYERILDYGTLYGTPEFVGGGWHGRCRA